jgi:uncharacterized RDD family membrane protein YckC
MTIFRVFLAAAILTAAGAAAAQDAPPEQAAPPIEAPAPAEVPLAPDSEQVIFARPAVRVGTPLVLGPNAALREAVVVMADATVAGRILGDLVVVLGDLRLERTAVIEGSVIVVGGRVSIDEGAAIEDDFVTVGGEVDAPAGFIPGSEHVVFGPPGLGNVMRDVAPWFTRGLLWGRVVVPDLPWVWSVVGIALLVTLIITVAFPGAVLASTETLSARPVGSLFAGVLALLLFAPVVTILAISFVGIPIIPFVVCAMVAGWLLGKASVARWLGGGIMQEEDKTNRGQALRSVLIGSALIVLAYMIPLIGLAAWALVGLFGLGTATLTAMAGLKRERPVPPPRPAPAPSPAAPGEANLAPGAGPAFVSEPPVPAAAEAPPVASREPYVPPASAPAYASASVRATAPSRAVPPGWPVDLTSFPRATFFERLGAGALDVILVMIGYNLFDWWHDGRAFLVLLLGYHMVFWSLKGTTVGGMILNLRLVRTDGAPLTPSDAVVRGLTSVLSAFALGLGFFWILRDPERQAWHDRVAGTYVVTVPRNWPSP